MYMNSIRVNVDKILLFQLKKMRRSIKSIFGILVFLSTLFLFYSLRKLSEVSSKPWLAYDLDAELLVREDVFPQEDFANTKVENQKTQSKKDWHDYKYIEYEKTRTGIGESGSNFELYRMNASAKSDVFYKRNGFNAALSDQISVNRSIPDIRHKDCRKKLYSTVLPKVSVILPFHNEHWSTLIRSCYSLINRSPRELLTEIILVDDNSDRGNWNLINIL